MALAITAEQEQLVDAVSRFATRHAPIDKTRAAFDSIASGELPSWWSEFVVHGFHAVHLPVDIGGQGGSLVDMACVVEAAAAALLPGPLLSTATASAVARLADVSAKPLLTELAEGATAVVILPEHSDVHAVSDGDAWRLTGRRAPCWESARHNTSCSARRLRTAVNGGSRWTRARKV